MQAFSAKDINKLGLTDQQQLEIAIREEAVILTNDADFIRIAVNKKHAGVIYIHQQKLTIGESVKRLKIIVETKTPEQMKNQTIFL